MANVNRFFFSSWLCRSAHFQSLYIHYMPYEVLSVDVKSPLNDNNTHSVEKLFIRYTTILHVYTVNMNILLLIWEWI